MHIMTDTSFLLLCIIVNITREQKTELAWQQGLSLRGSMLGIYLYMYIVSKIGRQQLQ